MSETRRRASVTCRIDKLNEYVKEKKNGSDTEPRRPVRESGELKVGTRAWARRALIKGIL